MLEGALKGASDLDAGWGLQERSLHVDSQLNSEAEQKIARSKWGGKRPRDEGGESGWPPSQGGSRGTVYLGSEEEGCLGPGPQ